VDIPVAMAWCGKAAGEGKHVPAMQYLGEIYNRGLPSIPRDAAESAAWFRLASDPDATVPSFSTEAIAGQAQATGSSAADSAVCNM
jgi:TPR repeat protein